MLEKVFRAKSRNLVILHYLFYNQPMRLMNSEL